MICRMLLLLILSSCVCAATFVVNVTQSSYQAEEKHNITLEWTFTTTPNSSSNSLSIYCELQTAQKLRVLFDVFKGVEVSSYIDEEFAGRVQSDKDVLREGRIRLHVSRLRTNDSGVYRCQVNTDDGWSSASCQLSVSEAAEESPPQRPTTRPPPERGGNIWMFVLVGCVVAAVLLVIISVNSYVVRKRKSRKKRVADSPKERRPSLYQSESELQLKTMN